MFDVLSFACRQCSFKASITHSQSHQYNCILLTCELSATLAPVNVPDGMVLQRNLARSTWSVGVITQLADLLSSESLRSEVLSVEFICTSERGGWTCPDRAKRPVKHPVKRGPVEGVLPSTPCAQTRQSTACLFCRQTKVLSSCVYRRWTYDCIKACQAGLMPAG